MPDPQRCISPPSVSVPSLPGPFSAKASFTLSISYNPKFCCKLPPLPSPHIPVNLPAILINPAITVIKQVTAIIQAFLNQLQVRCPRL
jgi:hypothetical protein